MRMGCDEGISASRRVGESGVESSQSPLATAVGAVAIFKPRMELQTEICHRWDMWVRKAVFEPHLRFHGWEDVSRMERHRSILSVEGDGGHFN